MSIILKNVARDNLQDAVFIDYTLSNSSPVSTLTFIKWYNKRASGVTIVNSCLLIHWRYSHYGIFLLAENENLDVDTSHFLLNFNFSTIFFLLWYIVPSILILYQYWYCVDGASWYPVFPRIQTLKINFCCHV